jgi:hypothetical protein
MRSDPPTLDYGGVATRRGVVCDWRDDGTLVITIPEQIPARSLRRWFDVPPALPGEKAPPVWRRVLGHMFGSWDWWGEPRPLAVIELSRDELAVTENVEGGMPRRAWPRAEITELRPNRYFRGLYLRIAGKENIDLLTFLDAELIKWLGEVLDQAMQSHRATESRP